MNFFICVCVYLHLCSLSIEFSEIRIYLEFSFVSKERLSCLPCMVWNLTENYIYEKLLDFLFDSVLNIKYEIRFSSYFMWSSYNRCWGGRNWVDLRYYYVLRYFFACFFLFCFSWKNKLLKDPSWIIFCVKWLIL